MTRGTLFSSTYLSPLRTPDGVGGGAGSTAPDNAALATGSAGSAPQPDSAAATPPAASAPAAAAVAEGSSSPSPGGVEPAAAAQPAPAAAAPHTPSLIEAAKGKDAAADGAAPPAATSETTETPAQAGDESKAAEPAKEAAKEPSAETSAGDAKAADAASDVKPPEPIKYDAFKVPDQVKLEDDRVKAFTDIVGPAQVNQETAQKLIDLYVAEMQQAADRASQAQRDYWTSQIDTWKTEIRKDAEIGGNRLETSLSIAKAVIEEYGGTQEQKAELWRHISDQGNGMGSYPGFVRLMHNIGRAMNVFEDSIVPAASAPVARSKEPGQRGWYGSERRASAG